MPYIPEEEREPGRQLARRLGVSTITAGQLNHAITETILAYLGSEPRYTDFNEVVGVLECAKLELVRRMLNPYEDKKCLENGDVY